MQILARKCLVTGCYHDPCNSVCAHRIFSFTHSKRAGNHVFLHTCLKLNLSCTVHSGNSTVVIVAVVLLHCYVHSCISVPAGVRSHDHRLLAQGTYT